jgi:formylglycine-generating enzyme required for sulfatase activity/WD40 repeat protein/ubiquitin-protein ligase/ribosomal protein L29
MQLTCPTCVATIPLLDGAGRCRTRCPVCNAPLPDEPAKVDNGAGNSQSSRQTPPAPASAPPPSKLPMRVRRLLADAEQMRQAAARSSVFRIQSMEGDPPELYRIEYRVHGLAPGPGGKPAPRDSHLVEIQLTSEYPRVSPKCKVLTPIFHPNIDPTTICVGDHWAAGERLVDLVVRIGEMIAYQAYNIKSPLDGEAAMWADLNQHRLPIDKRTLLPSEEGEPLPAAAEAPPTPEAAADAQPPAPAEVSSPSEEPARRPVKPVRRPSARRLLVVLAALAALLFLGAGVAGFVTCRLELGELGTQTTELRGDVTELRREVVRTQTTELGAVAELRREVAQLREESDRLGELRAQITNLRGDVAELRQEVARNNLAGTSNMAELRREVARMQITNLRGDVAELRREVAQLREEAAKPELLFSIPWQAHIGQTGISSDGRLFFGAGDAGPTGTIRVWEVATGKQVQELVPGGDAWFSFAQFLPGGKYLVASYSGENGGYSKDLFLWEIATGKVVRRFVGHTKPYPNFAVSPDGKRILSWDDDLTVRLWDVETGKELRKLKGHTDKAAGVFSPDGKQVLTFSPDKTLRLWDVETGKELKTLEGHTDACTGCFSPDGKQALSYGADHTIRLWDLGTGKEIRRFEGPMDKVSFAGFVAGGRLVVGRSDEEKFRVWETASGKRVCEIDCTKYGEDSWNITASPDGRLALVNDHQDDSVRVLDLADGKEIHRYDKCRYARAFSFSPDGTLAVAGSFRAGMFVFRLPPGKDARPSLLDCTGDKGVSAAAVRKAQEAWAKYLGRKVEEEDEVAPGVKMKFVLVPPGRYLMGSPKDEKGRFDREVQHEVEITKPFYLGAYDVTQAQYEAVTGKNPSAFKGLDLPVEQVSWEDANAFAKKLSEKTRDGLLYRLPTEGEWEYACRGGRPSSEPFGVGDGTSLTPRDANFGDSHLGSTSPVGSYAANALGLYDMHGNVWQWCSDLYEPGSLDRVLRGGSWNCGGEICRSAGRRRLVPAYWTRYDGFRLAAVPEVGAKQEKGKE